MKWWTFYFLIATISLSGIETYVYKINTEGHESEITWTVDHQKSEKVIHIKGEGEGETTFVVTTEKLVPLSFENNAKKLHKQYSITREKQLLRIHREKGGNREERSFRIGNQPWVQEFNFSLKPFILSSEKSFTFTIVDPKKLNIQTLVAIKRGIEPFQQCGKSCSALRVKITLPGFKKMFWHADAWFDPDDGTLLMYEANEGPNTPTSVTTLFSKK